MVPLLMTVVSILVPHAGEIVFGVKVTDVHMHGLDDPVNSPVIHPSFDLVLRVDNRRLFRDCWNNITITVFYGDKIIGWGTVPDLCVGGLASQEAKAAITHKDVVLTEAMRRSMASQLSTGELKFDVGTMFCQGGYVDRNSNICGSKKGFQHCRVNPGYQGYTACKHVYLHNNK
ncbi:hypothetical protein QOZ80_1AG0020060 [Eleusine coracana subsp. coracana]|nr:hypothetical protein QOZ80_1AG0020060 [Eleusine coracana subsp. coracana]